ncbi:MAG TPA: D-amino acid aminotransferase, partial [Kiloniellaceae bacterium]
MPRQAYVNGRYVPHGDAAVHIEDRGYQFADGVYEVVPVFDGILVDEDLHFDRLDRSLGELRIAQPMSRPAL